MGTHPIFESDFDCLTDMSDSLPEFEPEDPIPDLTINYENQDLQLRRLRREQIALQGGETEEEKWLYGLLGSEMKILITDQRVLLGQFICTDKERNVILQGASEYMSEEEIDSGTVGRSIGLAMVPGKHIVKMEIRKKDLDRVEECSKDDENLSFSITGRSVTAEEVAQIESAYESANAEKLNNLSLIDDNSRKYPQFLIY